MDNLSAIEVNFDTPVDLERVTQRALMSIINAICTNYTTQHPGRVMWPFGVGFKPTYMPMTQEKEQERGMEFDTSVFHIQCSEREDYEWLCFKCGLKQGDHRSCMAGPVLAGDCDFEPRAAPASPDKPSGLVPSSEYEALYRNYDEIRKKLVLAYAQIERLASPVRPPRVDPREL